MKGEKMAKMSTTIASDAMRRDFESVVGMPVAFVPSINAAFLASVDNYHAKRANPEALQSLPASKRVAKTDDASCKRRISLVFGASNVRSALGSVSLPVLREHLASFLEVKPVTVPAVMASVPYVCPANGGRHDCTVLPAVSKRKNAGLTGNDLVSECLTNWETIHIASVDSEAMQSKERASFVPCTVHAEAHCRRDASGDVAWAILFRAEQRHVDVLRGVDCMRARWINPSEMRGRDVDNLVAQCVIAADIDPKRLRFFVDASVPYRCESVSVKVNGKAYNIKVQMATADLMVKASKFRPMGEASDMASVVDAFALAEQRARAAKRAGSLHGKVRDITAEYKARMQA